MVAITDMLDRNGVIAYVGQHGPDYGLDPAAVLAVANHEGLNTAPGSSWKLPHETNISFGPPSWFGNGAGAALLSAHGVNAPAWSWTPAGIDYWLQQVASVASGLTGTSAISAIVHGFERPREDLAQGEINNATHDYATFQTLVGDPNVTISPSIPSQPQTSTQITTPATTTATVGPNGINAGQIGPWPINIPSGLILALIGVLLLIVGAIIMQSAVRNQTAVRINKVMATGDL